MYQQQQLPVQSHGGYSSELPNYIQMLYLVVTSADTMGPIPRYNQYNTQYIWGTLQPF